jgi:hypothetical protein
MTLNFVSIWAQMTMKYEAIIAGRNQIFRNKRKAINY